MYGLQLERRVQGFSKRAIMLQLRGWRLCITGADLSITWTRYRDFQLTGLFDILRIHASLVNKSTMASPKKTCLLFPNLSPPASSIRSLGTHHTTSQVGLALSEPSVNNMCDNQQGCWSATVCVWQSTVNNGRRRRRAYSSPMNSPSTVCLTINNSGGLQT